MKSDEDKYADALFKQLGMIRIKKMRREIAIEFTRNNTCSQRSRQRLAEFQSNYNKVLEPKHEVVPFKSLKTA